MHKKKPKVLLIHNILWSHYKAKVFSELYLNGKNFFNLKFIQIALTERSRIGLGEIERSAHKYPYDLLFDCSFHETTWVKRVWALAKSMHRFKPDIVILPGYSDISYLFIMVLAKLKGYKIILSADSTEYDQKRKIYLENFKKLLFKIPDLFYCYGSQARSYLLSLGVSTSKIHIRVQATDNERILDSYNKLIENDMSYPKSNNFLFVGRLLELKNLRTLFDAFHLCIRKNIKAKDWGIIIVGEGEARDNLVQYAEQLGIEQSIRFEGAKNWYEIPKYYKTCEVFILPSYSEVWGLVINEAMLCRLPIVASSHCGATPDLVKDGVNGFIFDPYDAEQLSSQLSRFINEEINLKVFGERSFSLISQFTPQISALQMIEGIYLINPI